MDWLLYTGISVLGLSISILLQRILIAKLKVDLFGYAVLFQGLVGVLLVIVCLLTTGFNFDGLSALWLPALICVVCYGVGHIVYAKTLQHVEASAFSVLFATHAIWVMALGILLLGESLTPLQIVGSVMIFGGVLLLVKDIRAIGADRGTLYGLATGLIFGVAIYTWSYVGRYTDTLSWAAISFVAAALVALIVYPKSVRKMRSFVNGAVVSRMLLLAVFYGIGSVAMLYAYKEGTFSVVSPLRQTGIIVTVLLALAFLPAERNRIGRKLLASAICSAGVVAIII